MASTLHLRIVRSLVRTTKRTDKVNRIALSTMKNFLKSTDDSDLLNHGLLLRNEAWRLFRKSRTSGVFPIANNTPSGSYYTALAAAGVDTTDQDIIDELLAKDK